jgi:8-oxo-dGTP pyrophosphatase MutT (NUDIX family)
VAGSPLLAALQQFSAVAKDERSDVDRLLELARSGAPFDRCGALHVTGSAFVVDPMRRRVLLRFHPRLARWLQVGGHGEATETDPFAVARREAVEETGLDDLVSYPDATTPNLLQVTIVDVAANAVEPAHAHGDLRYLLATSHPERAVAESVDAPLRWIPIESVPREPLDAGVLRGLARVGSILALGPGRAFG